MSQCDKIVSVPLVAGLLVGPEAMIRRTRCDAFAVARLASATNPDLIPHDLCRAHFGDMVLDWVIAGHDVRLEPLDVDAVPITRQEWEARLAAKMKRGRGRLAP